MSFSSVNSDDSETSKYLRKNNMKKEMYNKLTCISNDYEFFKQAVQLT